MRRTAGLVALVALLACGACGGGTAHAGARPSPAPVSFVARYYDAAAHLTLNRGSGAPGAAMDLAHPGAGPSAALVQEHLDLGLSIDGDTITLTRGLDAPWTGTLAGKNLVLTWAPDGATFITTTFTAGSAADYRSATAEASREYGARQQAIASQSGSVAAALAAKQAQDAAARLAAHEAQVAASRAAHDSKVAAMRSAHAAKVAAMQRQQAAARAKAAAHHP